MLAVYGLAWRAALPALGRNKRLRAGWEQRVLSGGPPPRADLWIQAASGGEAYLARELLSRLPDMLPNMLADKLAGAENPLTVLVTTFTTQGLEVLSQAAQDLAPRLRLLPAYVPFDLPGRMERALAAVSPRAVVLLETELWPGLMAACRRQKVPVLVLNARMTDKSLGGYLRMPGFWRALFPTRALAVSEADAARFAKLFPDSRVGVMQNIKFDRLRLEPSPPKAELAELLPPGAPFIVLGSVRRQEEEQVLALALSLLERRPETVIGLFPRHMERVEAWAKLLIRAGRPFARRSAGEAVRPGSLILWDAFGELGQAFGLATTCFVGGSLADLGGQNFLEPLAHGVVPVIGPYWSNFAWVGEEIFEAGLARRASGWESVRDALLALTAAPPDREAVRARAQIYADCRRGGAVTACQAVAECLNCG